MNENKYRLYKAFLLTVFFVGVLLLGFQYVSLYSQQVQTGRFVQYENSCIDTRTGLKYIMVRESLVNMQTYEEFKP